MRTVTVILGALVLSLAAIGCGAGGPDMQKIQEQKAGTYTVALFAPGGKLVQGDNRFAIEVTENGAPVDVSKVTVNSTMPMPGMPNMIAKIETTPAAEPGRLEGTANFEMRGGWDLFVELPSGQRVPMKLQIQ